MTAGFLGRMFREGGWLARTLGLDPTAVQPDIRPPGSGPDDWGYSKNAMARIDRIERARARLLGSGGGAGRGAGGLAGLGIAGALGYQTLNTVTESIADLYRADVPMAQGLYSGSATAAAQSAVQYQAQREMAIRHAGIGGIGGAASTVAMGVGGASVAGAAVAGAAIPGVGVALLAIGALTKSLTDLANAAADSKTQVEAARRSAAISLFEEIHGRRVGLAQNEASLMGFARNAAGAEMLHGRFGGDETTSPVARAAKRLLMDPNVLAGRMRSFIGAGAQAEHDPFRAAALEVRDKVSMESQARYLRTFQRGEGATIGGGGPQQEQAMLEGVVKTAFDAGLTKHRIGDYLGRIAQTNEAMADRGLIVDERVAERSRRGLIGAGLTPMQALGAQTNVGGLMQEEMGSLVDLRMPMSRVKALIRQQALRQFGGVDEAIAGMEKLSGDRDASLTFLRNAGAGLDATQLKLLMSQGAGVFPSLGGKLAAYTAGADRGAGPSGETMVGRAHRFLRQSLGLDTTEMLSQKVVSENVKTFGLTPEKIAENMDMFNKIIRMSVENLRDYPPEEMFRTLREAIDTFAADSRSRPLDYRPE